MNNQPRCDRAPQRVACGGLILSVAGLLMLASGCGESHVRLVSYRDPYFPEHYYVKLADCAYRTAPGGGIQAAGRAVQQTEQGTTTHYLSVHIFWKPIPGKTHAESSMIDAILQYVVSRGDGVAVYSGTGFAYPKETSGGGLDIALESGRLRLKWSSNMDDLLGNSQITGQLQARNDPAAAATLMREAELLAARGPEGDK